MAELFGQRFDQHTDDVIATTNLLKELADRVGKYVWKKYEYVDSTISMTMTNYGSSGTALVTMTSNDFDITKLNIEDLAGITVNYGTASNKWVLQFVDSSSIILDGNIYGSTWDSENAQMKISANFGAIVTFENFNATVKIFSDYVVSDNSTAYPDGGEQDGYWYEKVSEGVSGIQYGTVTLTSAVNSISIAHSLKGAKKFFLIPYGIATSSNQVESVSIADIELIRVSSSTTGYSTYAKVTSEGGFTFKVVGEITDTTATVTSVHNSTGTTQRKFNTGTYLWIVML